MSTYPEHEKQSRAIMAGSQSIGEFIEWAQSEGVVLAEWQRKTDCRARYTPRKSAMLSWECQGGRRLVTDVGASKAHEVGQDLGECDDCGGTGLIDRIEPVLYPTTQSITKLLARFFDIDLNKLEAEKEQMLEELRCRG